MGKYRWLQLPFGLLVSSDIFMKRLDAVIKMIPGVRSIADNVLAKGNDETSHDVAVLSLLKTTRCNNHRFNPNRIKFKTKECKFFQKLLTPEGMSINQKKVDALKKMNEAKSKKKL